MKLTPLIIIYLFHHIIHKPVKLYFIHQSVNETRVLQIIMVVSVILPNIHQW